MTDDPTGYALPVGSYEDARAMVGQRTDVRFGHIDVNEAMVRARPRLAWALILNPTARYRGRGDAVWITARLERLASVIAEISEKISGNSGTAARDFCCNPLCYRYRLERRPGRACSTRAWGYPR